MEEEEPMCLNLACIYHYVKLAYFSYAYTAPGMFFADLSHMIYDIIIFISLIFTIIYFVYFYLPYLKPPPARLTGLILLNGFLLPQRVFFLDF